MRPEITALLEKAGVSTPGDRFSWDRLVMTTSRGSLVNPELPPEADPAERGFHFLVVSESGRPTHYCKVCAAREDGTLHRRSEVLERLCADPRARRHVPRTTTVRNARLELHVSEYLEGRPLDQVLHRAQGRRKWDLVERTLDAAALLSQAFQHAPGRAPAALPVRDLTLEALDALGDLGVPRGAGEIFRDGILGAPAPPGIPQHGDLWSANVLIRGRRDVCLLDFDRFDLIDAPLYDVFHLVRTLDDVCPSRGPGPWVDRVLGAGPAGLATRTILAKERARWDIDPLRVGVCFLFYVLHIAVRTHRRGAWKRFLAEIPATAAWMRRLGSAEQLGVALVRAGG